MDTRTGDLHELKDGESMSQMAQRVGVPDGHMRPVVRELTLQERLRKQINKYAPCGCGSGKKFKFCCFKK